MHATAELVSAGCAAGLRLTAEEFFALPDDGNRYELIDGVVHISPSPAPSHQLVVFEILMQLGAYVRDNKLGLLLPETDVHLGKGAADKDLVYRPEMVFIAAPRVGQVRDRIRLVPDLVVEVVSPDSRGFDSRTKFDDYQRAGVKEYWLIDPLEEKMFFYRLQGSSYTAAPVSAQAYESAVVPGFRLDLDKVRAAFRAIGARE